MTKTNSCNGTCKMRWTRTLGLIGGLIVLGSAVHAGQDPFAPASDSGLGTAGAQTATQVGEGLTALPPRSADAPDVQVLVLSGMGGEDQVNLTYPTLVSHVQVQRDIDALTKTASWPQHRLSVTDSALPISGYKTPAMTSASFTSPGVVTATTGHFELEPIIVALRSYPKIAVTFIVSQPFGFTGLRRYADSHVTIALKQMGSAYVYSVKVQNPQFTRLNLPVWQADPATVHTVSAPVKRSAWGALRIVSLIVVTMCAAAAGCGVYVWLARLQ